MEIDPTKLPECNEGPEAFQRFDAAMRQLLSIPHSTIMRRERARIKALAAILRPEVEGK